MNTSVVNTAATALGLSENVIKNFLCLVESLEKHSSDNIPKPNNHNTVVDLDDLVNEYAKKL